MQGKADTVSTGEENRLNVKARLRGAEANSQIRAQRLECSVSL